MALTARIYDGSEFSADTHHFLEDAPIPGWEYARRGHTGDRWTNVRPWPSTAVMFSWPLPAHDTFLAGVASEFLREPRSFQNRDDGQFIRVPPPPRPWWRRVLDWSLDLSPWRAWLFLCGCAAAVMAASLAAIALL